LLGEDGRHGIVNEAAAGVLEQEEQRRQGACDLRQAQDALPRKGNVSTGRRKPVVQPPIDAAMETEVEASAIVEETMVVEAAFALPSKQ
jgi:hypothetical protein